MATRPIKVSSPNDRGAGAVKRCFRPGSRLLSRRIAIGRLVPAAVWCDEHWRGNVFHPQTAMSEILCSTDISHAARRRARSHRWWFKVGDDRFSSFGRRNMLSPATVGGCGSADISRPLVLGFHPRPAAEGMLLGWAHPHRMGIVDRVEAEQRRRACDPQISAAPAASYVFSVGARRAILI